MSMIVEVIMLHIFSLALLVVATGQIIGYILPAGAYLPRIRGSIFAASSFLMASASLVTLVAIWTNSPRVAGVSALIGLGMVVVTGILMRPYSDMTLRAFDRHIRRILQERKLRRQV